MLHQEANEHVLLPEASKKRTVHTLESRLHAAWCREACTALSSRQASRAPRKDREASLCRLVPPRLINLSRRICWYTSTCAYAGRQMRRSLKLKESCSTLPVDRVSSLVLGCPPCLASSTIVFLATIVAQPLPIDPLLAGARTILVATITMVLEARSAVEDLPKPNS